MLCSENLAKSQVDPLMQSNAGGNLGRSVAPGSDPYEEYDNLLKRFQDAQKE